ncbi:phage tail spike protein [Bacillus licheniformis]|uniref:phage tail spike protein n=1 Tax=Bacillus licheniformis TaxID=1402 RepID=UPI00237CF2A6|nr:phage tail spike protein [Bacillus licheniformis]MDE1406964.1 phage tail protein [Bacillus licheniformis]
MFINIDYNKRPQKAKLHLAKPNKQIISHISEKFNDSLSVKLGNINELNFSIPHYIEDEENNTQIINPHVESIREKMLIRVKMGAYKEWFIVDEIEEDADDSDTFNVTAYSLGYELKSKRISDYEMESGNAVEVLDDLLEETIWAKGEIDPMFESVYRTFESGEDSNILECIKKWAETYGGLLEWDTENRKVSLKDIRENGRFKGGIINYGKFLKSLKRSRTTDELVTRLWVYGSEDLTIHSVNPTGQGYIEDFSYFMHPFEMDSNGVVKKSSYYMSDDLCKAIISHKALVEANAPEITAINKELSEKRTELIIEQSSLNGLNQELENILELLDTAQAVLAKLESEVPRPDTTAEKAQVNSLLSQRDSKQVEISLQTNVVNDIQTEITKLEKQLSTLQSEIENQANFTSELRKELNPFIIESVWKDDDYIDEQELYNDALEKFEEIRKPKVVIEVDIVNLMNVIEEQYYWDKFMLGDLIKIKYPQMNIEYMAKIIEINYDLENGEATLTIANTNELLNDTEKLAKLLYSNSSASSLIQSNKHKWDKISAVSKQVNSILTSEWDANKNKIIAGVRNSIEVGNRGIIIRSPDFPNEIVIMQAGIIALSKDGGETWKTAIKPDGIVAERLIGQIIAGQELLITNSSGSFTLDDNGAVFDVNSFIIRSNSGNNLINRWENNSDFVEAYKDDNLITPYEKKMLKIKWEEFSKRYDANMVKVNNYYENPSTLWFVSEYVDRYNQLYEYLFVTVHGDKPMLSDDNMAYTTRIVGTEFDAMFRNYDNALVELEKQLDIRAKEMTDKAIQDAKNAQDNIDEVENDIAYKIELHSSQGSIFKNGQINTIITAKVYKGKNEITSTIPNSGFIWRKRDKDGTIDTSWGNAHVNVGNTITVDRNDVVERAVFECDIDIAD